MGLGFLPSSKERVLFSLTLHLMLLFVCARGDDLLIVKGGSAILGGTIQLDCWSKAPQDTKSILTWERQPHQLLFFENMTGIRDPRIQLVSWQPHRSIISIQSLKEEDQGIYTCTDYGSVIPLTGSARVNVWVPPSLPVVSGLEKPIGENESIEFLCTSNLGRPPATIHWLKNGQLLYGTTHLLDMMGNVRNTVRILVNRRDDGRHVSCVVSHLTGTLQTNFALQVEYPPELEISKTSGRSSVGEELTYECRTKGRPRPSTPQWFHDEKSLSTRRSSGLSNFLILSNLSLSDTGVYVCISRNRQGETKATLNIFVSECSCNDHSNTCEIEQGWHGITGNLSRCIGCRHNTTGRHCQVCSLLFCRDFNYVMSHHNACKPCDCSVIGSRSDMCNLHTGQCFCKEGVEGLKCSRCAEGYQLLDSITTPCTRVPDGSVGHLVKRHNTRSVLADSMGQGSTRTSTGAFCRDYCKPQVSLRRWNFAKLLHKREFAIQVEVSAENIYSEGTRYEVLLLDVFKSVGALFQRGKDGYIFLRAWQIICSCPPHLNPGMKYLIMGNLVRSPCRTRQLENTVDLHTIILPWQETWRNHLEGLARDERFRRGIA